MFFEFRKFPPELWEQIAAWCNRLELGERVSLVDRRLFATSHPFMHEEKVHPLPSLKFDKTKKEVDHLERTEGSPSAIG